MLLGLLLFCVIAVPAHGRGTTIPIALTAEPSPSKDRAFTRFGVPVINDAGQVAFRATVVEQGRMFDAVYTASGTKLGEVARGNERAPDGNGRFEYFSTPLFNSRGDVAFWIGLIETRGIKRSSDDEGIFLSRNGVVTPIIREGQVAPHGRGIVEGFLSYDFNAVGTVSFLLATKNGRRTEWAVYLGDGGKLTQIAVESAHASGNFGRFTGFGAPSLNDAGEVAFSAATTGVAAAQNVHTAIYRGSGGPLTEVARVGDVAADGNARFSGFVESIINGAGQVAFIAALAETKDVARNGTGVFLGNGGPLQSIARAGQSAPDGNGYFSDFKAPAVNDAGTVAFSAFLSRTQAGVKDDSGIFFGDGVVVFQIAREGALTPDGSSMFSELDPPALNQAGMVAFGAVLAPAGGSGRTRRAIYFADGREMFPVVRTGDAVAGGKIEAISFRGRSKSAGRRGLNDFGQVAYQASLSDGRDGVFRYTPALHWRHLRSGGWDSASNWSLGLSPGPVHEVFIDPPHDLTVTGPTGRSEVQRLVIGSKAGTATLRLSGGTIRASDAVEIASAGVLTGVGTIDGDVRNRGTVRTKAITVSGMLRNDSCVRGQGHLNARLIHAANEVVCVNVGDGLTMTAPANVNGGLREAVGGRLTVTRRLTNEADGRIEVRGATLQAEGGLVNRGTVHLIGHRPKVLGSVLNTGNVVITDGAEVTFHGPVTNDAEIHADAGTQTIFRGRASGTGSFSGFGGTALEGGFSPGVGASRVTFAGDLVLGFDNSTTVELGGTAPGSGHDAVDVGGNLVLGGILDVRLVPGVEEVANFTPSAADEFVLFRAAHITGNFRHTKLPTLRRNLRWAIRQTATEYALAVRKL